MNLQEINKLVAEHVMGWKLEVAMDGVTEYYDTGEFGGGKWTEQNGELSKKNRFDDEDIFQPCQRVQDAWLVLEKLSKEKDWRFIIDYSEHETQVTAKNKMGACRQILGVSESVPVAMCLAALEAVGIEYKEEM